VSPCATLDFDVPLKELPNVLVKRSKVTPAVYQSDDLYAIDRTRIGVRTDLIKNDIWWFDDHPNSLPYIGTTNTYTRLISYEGRLALEVIEETLSCPWVLKANLHVDFAHIHERLWQPNEINGH